MNDTAAKKDVTKLQRAIVDALEDVKAQDIQVFDTEHLSALFERVVVASGTSNRQTKALAASVRDKVREAGFPKPRMEGEDNGEWIIVDCGSAVVHVMQPTIRSYYNLEELWGDKPVRLKLGAAKPLEAAGYSGTVKTDRVNHAGKAPRRVEPEPVKAQMPGRPGAKKAVAKPATKTAGKTAAKPVSKTAAKPANLVAAKTSAKSTSPKTASVKPNTTTTAKPAVKAPLKMVKVNAPSKAAKKTAAKSAAKSAPKPVAKRAPAKKAAPRQA
ncbi:ribosome silencing factor [Limnohabitans sp. Rim8]|uniref:ribosome silencing factor n=1 Tax=Limnohabitans sp. Rim8 TaxID=1100718 RepID=UPI003305C3EB